MFGYAKATIEVIARLAFAAFVVYMLSKWGIHADGHLDSIPGTLEILNQELHK